MLALPNGCELSGRGSLIPILSQLPASRLPLPSDAASPVRSSELLGDGMTWSITEGVNMQRLPIEAMAARERNRLRKGIFREAHAMSKLDQLFDLMLGLVAVERELYREALRSSALRTSKNRSLFLE